MMIMSIIIKHEMMCRILSIIKRELFFQQINVLHQKNSLMSTISLKKDRKFLFDSKSIAKYSKIFLLIFQQIC